MLITWQRTEVSGQWDSELIFIAVFVFLAGRNKDWDGASFDPTPTPNYPRTSWHPLFVAIHSGR